jgi:CBS domain-containing protein
MTDYSDPSSLPISALTGDVPARISTDANLIDVASTLVNGNMGAVIVGEEPRPTAVVSERDLVRAMAEGLDPAATPVMHVATTKLFWCDVDATVAEVASQMMEHYVRHILVEDDGELVGIVSARDLLGICSADFETED